jgi:hypothetical protein
LAPALQDQAFRSEAADAVSAKDLAFCAEFAQCGGVAASSRGFRAEAELLRMQRVGLLDLQRDAAAPFAVIRVTMTDRARALVSAPKPARAAPAKAPVAGDGDAKSQRSHGFEVARGVLSAAIKAELSSWHAQGEPGGAAALETRVMTRISHIPVPFPA